MEKSFLNLIYLILEKSAESYYCDSMRKEVPYLPYFWGKNHNKELAEIHITYIRGYTTTAFYKGS